MEYCATHGKRFICPSCERPDEGERVKQVRMDLWAEQLKHEKTKREVKELMAVNAFLNNELRAQ
jgi:hypothetical protein